MLRGITDPFASMGGSSRTGLLVAVVLAMLTFVLIFAFLSRQEAQDVAPVEQVGFVTVVTAKIAISAGTTITAEMLETSSVAEANVQAGSYRDATLAVGQVARIPILPGEQLLPVKLTTPGGIGTGLTYVVPEGMRAMAISVSKVIGAGGLLRPGDRVDVFGVIEVTSSTIEFGATEPERTRQAVVVAQNLEVLAVEQELIRVPVATGNEGRDVNAEGTLVDQPEAQPTSTVATLAVSIVEAQKILAAETSGIIRLALRAPGDTADIPVFNGTIGDTFFGETAIPEATDDSLAFIVPQGHRAIAIRVTKVTSAGGLVRPGDYVDLLAVLQVETIGDGVQESFARSITVGQALEVLAVEQALASRAEAVAAGESPSEAILQPGLQPEAIVVTLAVTPLMAQQILLAEEKGVIRLSVRPPGDLEILDIADTAFFSIANTTAAASLFFDATQSIPSGTAR